MKTLSERIEKILQDRPDLGQSGLVTASGASKSVVNQWLDGKIKSMRLDYAINIERTLGYSHVWLVLGDGDMRTKRGDWPFSISYGQFASLPEAERKSIDQFIRFTFENWNGSVMEDKQSA